MAALQPSAPLSPVMDAALNRSAGSTAGTASGSIGGGLRRVPSKLSSAGGSATLVPIEESLPRLDPFSDWQIRPDGEHAGDLGVAERVGWAGEKRAVLWVASPLGAALRTAQGGMRF